MHWKEVKRLSSIHYTPYAMHVWLALSAHLWDNQGTMLQKPGRPQPALPCHSKPWMNKTISMQEVLPQMLWGTSQHEWLLGVKLRHPLPPVQHMFRSHSWEGWWLSSGLSLVVDYLTPSYWLFSFCCPLFLPCNIKMSVSSWGNNFWA